MKKLNKEELNGANATLSAQGLIDSPAVSDEQLLQSYREASDPTVFAELVSRYQRELYNYLRRFLGDATLAEDVFQATFFQVHQKRDSFEEGRKFRPWLYTIATNQAIDAQRRTREFQVVNADQLRCRFVGHARTGQTAAQDTRGRGDHAKRGRIV